MRPETIRAERAARYREIGREVRNAATRRVELRRTEAGLWEFDGYAAIFNETYEVEDWLGVYTETVMPGNFTQTLAQRDDVRFMINHEGLPIARTKSGTLQLAQDPTGLRVQSGLEPRDPDVQAIVPKMDRGDLTDMSHAFKAVRQDWNADYTDRKLLESKLYDVALVAFAASGATWGSIRDAGDLIEALSAFEGRDLSTELMELRSGRTFEPGKVRAAARAATMLVADLAEELRSAGVDRGALTAARTTLLSALEEDRAGDSHVATERRYDRIAAYIGQTVWAIHPAWLATILGIVGERRSGHRPTAGEIRRRIAGRERRAAAVDESGGIAVIPIVGPIVPKAAMVDDISGDGGTSMEGLLAAFRAAMGSNDVSAIVFDVDSPGGSVDLVPEAASEIMAARGTKPIVAVADTIAASAAYWLASAADELVVTPSGQVGSIGVYSAHEDISVWLENEGLKETLISAGEYKVEANPFEPLAEEAAAEIQRHVNAFYAMFLAAVASQRGVSVDAVSADFGQGRMVLATDAVTRGMADSVATLDQVLARLGRTAPPDPGERDTGNTMDLDMAQREIELLKLTR